MIVVFAHGDTIYSVFWYNCTQCGYIYAWVGVTFTQNYVLIIQVIYHVQINGKRLQTNRMLHWSKKKLHFCVCAIIDPQHKLVRLNLFWTKHFKCNKLNQIVEEVFFRGIRCIHVTIVVKIYPMDTTPDLPCLKIHNLFTKKRISVY